MIVVLDTNTIVSALLSKKGAPRKVIQRWEKKEFDIAVSNALLDELARVLEYDKVKKRFFLSQEEVDFFFKNFKEKSVFVIPQEKIEFIVADPDDDRVLECAVEAGATYIISGDKHLLNLSKFRGIVILSSTDFLNFLILRDRK